MQTIEDITPANDVVTHDCMNWINKIVCSIFVKSLRQLLFTYDTQCVWVPFDGTLINLTFLERGEVDDSNGVFGFAIRCVVADWRTLENGPKMTIFISTVIINVFKKSNCEC